MDWTTLCRRTDDPKLAYIETKLTELGISHRRNGASAHAPILEVPADEHERAYAFLLMPFDGANENETVDDVADDEPTFEDEYTAHDWYGPRFSFGTGRGPAPEAPSLPRGY